MAARAHDKLAIDGPYLQIKDVDGYRRVAGRSAALGFDGKWVLHPPGQIDAANETFSRCRPTSTTPRTSSTPTTGTRPSRWQAGVRR